MNSLRERQLLWEGGYNIRDLGGLITRDNQRIGWGRLVRADNLGHLTAAGQAALVAYGIRTIIDTRSAEERLISPPAFAAHPTVTTAHIPVARSADPEIQAVYAVTTDVMDWNLLTVQHSQRQIAQVLQHVAHAQPGGTLIHCLVGKDRTGIAIAFILDVLGIGREQIIEDYAASAIGLQPLFEQWRAASVEDPKRFEAFASLRTANPETMRALLTHVDAEYGGVAAYLQEGGFGADDQQVLRQRLLEEKTEL